MKSEQVPRVLNWGSAPFSFYVKNGKPVVYSDGLELEVVLGPELVFVETLRVLDGVTEHRFECEGVVGDWQRVRVQAFQECVRLAGKSLPTKKMVIFGPSHTSIQEGVRERFPDIFEKIIPAVDVEADAARTNKKKVSGKRVRWGDECATVVEGPCEGHKYSGWGLEAFCIIPNRDQLREMCMSMAERQLDSADLDEYPLLDDEEDFVQQFSIFTDDQNDLFDDDKSEFDNEANIDDDKTVFPSDEQTMEIEDEDETESDSDDFEQSIVPQSDSDEESPVEPEVSSRKRVKMILKEEDECPSEIDNCKIITKKIPIPSSPTCRAVDHELHESDFWLLERDDEN